MQRLFSLLYFSGLVVLATTFVPASLSTETRHGICSSATTTLSSTTTAASSAAAAQGSASSLKSILKKPSKVLTIGVDCDFASMDTVEISVVSMQLRKSKVSSIWCENLEAIKEFSTEQETARGSFPGPLPIIYSGHKENTGAAVDNGASAVVLSAGEDVASAGDAEVIWRVTNLEEVTQVLEATSNAADVFLVDLPNEEESIATFEGIIQSLPKTSLCIASLDPMQDDGAEVSLGKQLKKIGCGSVLVRSALVGDAEDLPYAQFLVDGLTSKASSEFNFSGLTGSTNGHFGGIQATGTTKWRRMEQ